MAPEFRPLDDEILEAAAALATRHGLTYREAQVFSLKGSDWTHPEIGRALGIAVGTSKSLLSRARCKVGKTV
jgi:DNA-directed RNA polymerase specialized sigma24 family protein